MYFKGILCDKHKVVLKCFEAHCPDFEIKPTAASQIKIIFSIYLQGFSYQSAKKIY